MAAKSFGLRSGDGALVRRAFLWALAICTFVLLAAWVDGGEEPLRMITEPVEVQLEDGPTAAAENTE